MEENRVEEIEVFVGSGNVFADLGLPNPEERQLKAHLSIEIEEAIRSKRLSRAQAARKIGLDQEELAQVLQGQLACFSVGQLINYLNCLDREVELSVSVHKRQPVTSASRKKLARQSQRCKMPLQITTEYDKAMRQHAARDYPHECCGFLVGKSEGEAVTLARVVPAANTREDSPRNRFEIDPGELVKTDRAARAEGLGVVGFYHSHPDAPAQPSEFDREHAWPGYCYVIVSVRQGQPQEMRLWLLRDDRSGFDEEEIISA